MSITQLLKFLSLLRAFLASVWRTALPGLRQLNGLLLRLSCHILSCFDLRPPPPTPPPPTPSKNQDAVERQRGRTSLTPPSSLSTHTVVFGGATVPLNEALFSMNPAEDNDNFRSSHTALSLPNRQQGSQLSLWVSSPSIASENSLTGLVPTTSPSDEVSTSSLPLCVPDPQEKGDTHHSGKKLQPPERQATQAPDIEVAKHLDDGQTNIQIPSALPVPSNEAFDSVGTNQLGSDATSHVPDVTTPYTQGPSGSPNSNEPRLAYASITETTRMESLTPAVPSENRRYIYRKKIEKKRTNIILSPKHCGRKSYHRGLGLPHGWTRITHPEGGCYFYHSASGIYTDNEIYDPEELEQIEAKMNAIEFCRRATDDFPPDTHIVLNIYGDEPGDIHCYCVNHVDRMIFFLSEFHTKWLQTWGEVEGAYSRHHLLHELEAEYWNFVHLYPDSIKLSQTVMDDLKDVLFFFKGDVTTSPYSTSPYDSDGITNLLNILPMLEGHVKCQTSTAGSVEFIARIMMRICHQRFLHFYGEPCARLERDFSVYGDALFPRTPLFHTVSLLLFSTPDVYLPKLQRIWVDQILYNSEWKQTITKFSSEWQDLVAYATIMLNANVAFLAIQSVDSAAPSRSSAQILSYASIIANLASMILGLSLTRQFRIVRVEPSDMYTYLFTGLELLAITFSLPYGMISFFVAFSLMCLSNADVPTRIVVITCLILAVVCIIWCIHFGRGTNWRDTSQDNRSLAYSQAAELEKAREEDELKTVEEMEQDRDTERTNIHDSSVADALTVSSVDTSSHPYLRLRVPRLLTVRAFWNAFPSISMRTSRYDVERGLEATGMELRELDEAPGNPL